MTYIRKYRIQYREYEMSGLVEHLREETVEARGVFDAAAKLRRYLDRHDPFCMGIEIHSIEAIEGFIR
jgi:hypothetical protein